MMGFARCVELEILGKKVLRSKSQRTVSYPVNNVYISYR
jgi:hypothetical protein